MGFLPRKLMSDDNSTSSYVCKEPCRNRTVCNTFCSKFCPDFCDPTTIIYPPPTPASDNTNLQKSTHFLFIIIFTVLGAAFLVLCLFVFYVRFYRNRSNGRRRSLPETTQTRDDFLDENHGPIIDHPIWYINTIGLQPSIINSITVFKYKKGEGLVEGTDCSVCLSEFEEDETLRLLPKCSHAFHIPCIDTWLRSHTNCPMCRAPIVSNTENRTPEVIVNTEDFEVREENPVGNMEANGEEQSERSVNEGETSENRIIPEEEEGGIQAMRRSVSLDSMAASQISQAIGNDLPEGSNGDSENELDKRKESSLRIVTRRGAGNQSLLRLMCHCSIGRSLQNSPNFLRRSLSFNGKFSLCNNNNNNKNRNTNPPVRSF